LTTLFHEHPIPGWSFPPFPFPSLSLFIINFILCVLLLLFLARSSFPFSFFLVLSFLTRKRRRATPRTVTATVLDFPLHPRIVSIGSCQPASQHPAPPTTKDTTPYTLFIKYAPSVPGPNSQPLIPASVCFPLDPTLTSPHLDDPACSHVPIVVPSPCLSSFPVPAQRSASKDISPFTLRRRQLWLSLLRKHHPHTFLSFVYIAVVYIDFGVLCAVFFFFFFFFLRFSFCLFLLSLIINTEWNGMRRDED